MNIGRRIRAGGAVRMSRPSPADVTRGWARLDGGEDAVAGSFPPFGRSMSSSILTGGIGMALIASGLLLLDAITRPGGEDYLTEQRILFGISLALMLSGVVLTVAAVGPILFG